jgi:bifunctional non-homologous end joining protein LigD
VARDLRSSWPFAAIAGHPEASGMGLEEYRKKRDFQRTPEPDEADERPDSAGLSFVVQKHAASRLHYDFRLELDGTLKSWAVPKGPSLDPAQRRLAVHVEDHPLSYGGFEGVIPEGEYGAGPVIVWDRGRWEPVKGDASEAYSRGRLKFRLDGDKLHGTWNLVRMGGKAGDDGRNWLLIKEDDDAAAPGSDSALVDESPASVLSGSTIEEVERRPEAVWTGQGDGGRPDPSEARGSKKTGLPRTLKPQLATLVAHPPEGDGWIHEIKLDGYRLLCRRSASGTVSAITRNGKDWTDRFPAIAEGMAALPVESAVLDGEAVVFAPDGRTDFQRLQNSLKRGRASAGEAVLVAFDLLYLDGWDLREAPLDERKRLLERILRGRDSGPVRYGAHLEASGKAVYERACEMGVEGVISKRRDRPYRPGRGKDWLKSKCIHEQEFVIVGYTAPSGSRSGFGSLLLGVNDEDGELRHAGRVGTGFTDESLRDLAGRLGKLERKTSPLADDLTAAERRGVTWVRPELLAQVRFTEWTGDGRLRHPSFQGLREDREPQDVVREEPQATEDATEGAPGAAPDRKKSNGRKSNRTTPESRHETRMSKGGAVKIAGVRLTNPDRVLYPEQGITKEAMARYYEAVAEWILPEVADRPLTLVRCPQGHEKECFYQKHADQGFPDAVKRVEIAEGSGPRGYLYVDSIEGIVSLVQLGVLELHTWGSRREQVERPDRIIFDLDPDAGMAWEPIVEAARILHGFLDSLGLHSFLKTTGGKGLHIVVPLVRRSEWDEVKAFSKAVVDRIADAAPDRYTTNASKKKREGRIYLDYLRNGRGATAVAAYSTRARPGAPVSVPVRWDELGPSLRPDGHTIDSLPRRLSRLKQNPWAEYSEVRQSLTAKMKKEVGIE